MLDWKLRMDLTVRPYHALVKVLSFFFFLFSFSKDWKTTPELSPKLELDRTIQ